MHRLTAIAGAAFVFVCVYCVVEFVAMLMADGLGERLAIAVTVLVVLLSLVPAISSYRSTMRSARPVAVPRGPGRLIWLIRTFPELEHLDPQQRARLLGAVPWWTYPLMVGRALAGAYVLAGLGGVFVWDRTGSIDIALISAMCAAAGAAVVLYLWQISRLRRSMRAEIARAFHGRRPPFCLGCGYDLRASTGQRCPECGIQIGQR